MHCNQEQIEALLDGELVGPEQDAVLAHLRDCPGCRSYYRQLLAMEQALRADTDSVPEDLLPDIMGRVHATSQCRRRQPWLRAAMGMAACLVVVLGIYLVRQQAEKGGDSPFSGILPDSSANNSVGADEDTFTDEVTPSDGGLTFASGGTERQESSGRSLHASSKMMREYPLFSLKFLLTPSHSLRIYCSPFRITYR